MFVAVDAVAFFCLTKHSYVISVAYMCVCACVCRLGFLRKICANAHTYCAHTWTGKVNLTSVSLADEKIVVGSFSKSFFKEWDLSHTYIYHMISRNILKNYIWTDLKVIQIENGTDFERATQLRLSLNSIRSRIWFKYCDKISEFRNPKFERLICSWWRLKTILICLEW